MSENLGVVSGLAVRWGDYEIAWLTPEHGFDKGSAEKMESSALDETFTSGRCVKAFINHKKRNGETPIGSTVDGALKIWKAREGVGFSLTIPNTPSGRAAYRGLQSGELRGVSIGYHERDFRWVPSGRPDSSKIKVVTDGLLNEISLVGSPAYAGTIDRLRWKPNPDAARIMASASTPLRPTTTVKTIARPSRSEQSRPKIETTCARFAIAGRAAEGGSPYLQGPPQSLLDYKSFIRSAPGSVLRESWKTRFA